VGELGTIVLGLVSQLKKKKINKNKKKNSQQSLWETSPTSAHQLIHAPSLVGTDLSDWVLL
jgi:hypothetical protein